MIDLRRVETAVTAIAKDPALLGQIATEWFTNGAVATNNLVIAMLVRRGLPRPEAATGSACIMTGMIVILEYVKKKRGDS